MTKPEALQISIELLNIIDRRLYDAGENKLADDVRNLIQKAAQRLQELRNNDAR